MSERAVWRRARATNIRRMRADGSTYRVHDGHWQRWVALMEMWEHCRDIESGLLDEIAKARGRPTPTADLEPRV